jgi:hypothetical protein
MVGFSRPRAVAGFGFGEEEDETDVLVFGSVKEALVSRLQLSVTMPAFFECGILAKDELMWIGVDTHQKVSWNVDIAKDR